MKANKIILCLFGASLLVGCNTIGGVGKDVEKSGEAITGAAQTTSEKMSN
jgi:predicted small secreted protein